MLIIIIINETCHTKSLRVGRFTSYNSDTRHQYILTKKQHATRIPGNKSNRGNVRRILLYKEN